MTFDLLIRNGTIVDGTGATRFSGDVGVTAGRITEVGTIPAAATAAQVIDAQGKMVCPGFIDPHTHYDPQITWDNVLSSSSEHGI
ncbi:MAG TPA: amidohydrolase family protein, partial [Burkholderiales bacterium]|nr:amidohydrolase family protein [Burkholderiales bacterium]